MAIADKDILYKVAYEEAVRALSEQQGTIDSFRTRAGLLLSAAAITTAEEPAPIDELHRDLSLHMHNSHIENREGLNQLAVFFQIASGLLTVEVVLWIIAIASTASNRPMAQTKPPTPPPEPKRPSPMQAETRGLSLGKSK